jgi:hypothetical protein
MQRFYVLGESALPAGTHQVRLEFAYDGGGLAKGGTATLYVDGTPVGSGRVDITQPMMFGTDETLDVGRDTASPVSDAYPPGANHFSGTVAWVQLDIGKDDHGHLITTEHRFKVAMMQQ